jgi:hypothetical protein
MLQLCALDCMCSQLEQNGNFEDNFVSWSQNSLPDTKNTHTNRT